jgi:hypothetical protein
MPIYEISTNLMSRSLEFLKTTNKGAQTTKVVVETTITPKQTTNAVHETTKESTQTTNPPKHQKST